MGLRSYKEYKYLKEDSEAEIPMEIPQGMASQFFSKLFESRDVAHLIHLSTKSYAKHKALQNYYESIVGLIDNLIEQYQGVYGLVSISVPESVAEDGIEYFSELYAEIQSSKKLFKEGNLLNIIDEISSLISGLLYKLKFLS